MNMEKRLKTLIKPYEKTERKIYAFTYDETEVPIYIGHIKVGQTKRDVDVRVNQQRNGLNLKILFWKLARKNDGTWFKDTELHRYFEFNKIKRSKETGGPTNGNEWFDFKGREEDALKLTEKFIENDYDPLINSQGEKDYTLRAEQKQAVTCTLNYFHSQKEPKEFLWNAKPRFGKTLTTYDFIRKLQASNALILCNRPAIVDSWFDDFDNFIRWRIDEGYQFVSESSAIKRKTMSYHKYESYKKTERPNEPIRRIAFVSLQGFKGAKFAGGRYEKLAWMQEVDWDVIILDEAHEAIDTPKSKEALNSLRTKFTLHLSGTPFKAIATEKFREDQIFNWTYLDEQKAKKDCDENNGLNPYEDSPQLNLFTYKMSEIIQKKLKSKIKDESSLDSQYAFDLGEFFRVGNNHKFVYEQDVKKFLDVITQGKYPFSSSEQYVNQLDHTFWLLPSVAAAKELKNLLNNHEFFKNFEIVLAVGKGSSFSQSPDASGTDFSNKKSLQKVRDAINKPRSKTITLSVGQITTGATVREWTGVFMLRNITSASLYFQSAFRVQSPHEYEVKNEHGQKILLAKENAYIFDFAPDRTLKLYDDFANRLLVGEQYQVNNEQRRKNIQAVLNFFPVIAEDSNGSLRELNIDDVLTMPNQIKSDEVVGDKFISNWLFANLGNISEMPDKVKKILDKLSPSKNGKNSKKDLFLTKNDSKNKNQTKEIKINQSDVLGKKITAVISTISNDEILNDAINYSDFSEIKEKIFKLYQSELNNNIQKFPNLPKDQINKIKTESENKIVEILKNDGKESCDDINKYKQLVSKKQKGHNLSENEQQTLDELIYRTRSQYDSENLLGKIGDVLDESLVALKTAENDNIKKENEDHVQKHLYGFTKTIPLYLMLCNDEDVSLENYETKTGDATFEKISGITKDEFLILKNGYDGQTGKVPGFFDEPILNNSIKAFFELKNKLTHYLDDQSEQDIFDYIPTQKINQIFTPKKLVEEMVDKLGEYIPGLFTNKNHKFLDPYCKSGRFLAEIVKRLNIGLQHEIADSRERIRWIFKNQIYGICPSDILLKLASNYLCAGRKDLHLNLQVLDSSFDLSSSEWLKDVIKKWWRDEKFDVIIGNPSYGEKRDNHDSSYQYSGNAIFSLENANYISLITPSIWMTGGRSFGYFREKMLDAKSLMFLYIYSNGNKFFANTEIEKKGINYFLMNCGYTGPCDVRVFNFDGGEENSKRYLKEPDLDIFVPYEILIKIWRKVQSKKDKFYDP